MIATVGDPIIQFPNFLRFCTDSRGLDLTPWASQIEFATKALGEWCPECSSNPYCFLHQVPVDARPEEFNQRIQFLEWGRCPRCCRTREDLVKQGWLVDYLEAVNCPGQNSGSTTLSVLIGAYLLHRILTLKESDVPQLKIGGPKLTFLGDFISTYPDPTQDPAWLYFGGLLTKSPWFIELLGGPFVQTIKEGIDSFTDGEFSFANEQASIRFCPTNVNDPGGKDEQHPRIFSIASNIRSKKEVRTLTKSVESVRNIFGFGLVLNTIRPQGRYQWYRPTEYYNLMGFKPKVATYCSMRPTVLCNPHFTEDDFRELDLETAIRDYGPKYLTEWESSFEH